MTVACMVTVACIMTVLCILTVTCLLAVVYKCDCPVTDSCIVTASCTVTVSCLLTVACIVTVIYRCDCLWCAALGRSLWMLLKRRSVTSPLTVLRWWPPLLRLLFMILRP